MYAVGYFLEVGVGTPPDMKEWVYAPRLPGTVVTDFRVPFLHRAISWYERAAKKGDRRATQRLKSNSNTPIIQPGGPGSVLRRNPDGEDSNGKSGKDKDCVIM